MDYARVAVAGAKSRMPGYFLVRPGFAFFGVEIW